MKGVFLVLFFNMLSGCSVNGTIELDNYSLISQSQLERRIRDNLSAELVSEKSPKAIKQYTNEKIQTAIFLGIKNDRLLRKRDLPFLIVSYKGSYLNNVKKTTFKNQLHPMLFKCKGGKRMYGAPLYNSHGIAIFNSHYRDRSGVNYSLVDEPPPLFSVKGN